MSCPALDSPAPVSAGIIVLMHKKSRSAHAASFLNVVDLRASVGQVRVVAASEISEPDWSRVASTLSINGVSGRGRGAGRGSAIPYVTVSLGKVRYVSNNPKYCSTALLLSIAGATSTLL